MMMENNRSKKKIRLVPHQESGRVRWCIGHERKWQKWLKRFTFIPIILIPIVVVLVIVAKYSVAKNENPTVNLHNLSLASSQRQKRNTISEERFSHLFKPSYELLIKLYPDRESFLETENNRDPKFDYFQENPLYFREKFSDYYYYYLAAKHSRRYRRTMVNYFQRIKTNNKLNNNNKNNKINNDNRRFQRSIKIESEKIDRFNLEEIRQEQAALMLKYMNPNVNPCVNFYEFACGNFKKHFNLPPDKIIYDRFEIVRENLYRDLKELLEADFYQERNKLDKLKNYHNLKDYINGNHHIVDESSAIIKVKKFYQSCMEEQIIEKRAEKPLLKLLKDLGGWPVINSNWKSSEFDLVWILSKLRLLNNDLLISQWVGPDIKNSSKYVIHIDQTTLGLPNRNYFLDPNNSKFIRAYKIFILAVVQLLGASSNINIPIKDIDDIVEFEIKLAKIIIPIEQKKNYAKNYHKLSVESLIRHYPNFNWLNYFTEIFGKEIDVKSTVACYCIRYIHRLFNLISTTSPRIIQNYLLWRFIRHRINNLDGRFLESEQKFYNTLLGREKQPLRWKFCVKQTNTNMGMALGALFVRNYFDKSSKNEAIKITEEIMKSYIDTINEKKWIDENIRKIAIMKIKNMDLKIGFPNFLFNDTELNLKYKDVKIETGFFFENVLSILKHTSKEDQNKLNLLVDKSMWNTPPLTVNAYYSRNKNQIMFPAGILQPPFYHKFFPKALNFGGIGVVIGHEITHALDDKGRLFDHEGNLQVWWNNDSVKNFYEKSQCIIDQYQKYKLPQSKENLNGMMTQSENIADNGGLKHAFYVYEKWSLLNNSHHHHETLPGLNLNGYQLFFLNFAQSWCGIQRDETEKNIVKNSLHSPGIYRVIGTLTNSNEFSRVFNCSATSPMNSQDKCDLW